jgi:glucose dehydrogenase
MLETDANKDLLNYRITVSTVTVQKLEPYTNFWDAKIMAVCQPFGDVKTLGGETLSERYEQTLSRIEQIKRAGYQLKIQWEYKFGEAKIVEHKPELLVHPTVKHAPLISRDALYGGRTEATRIHYKIREGDESVQYCDVMSSYPYICKYFKFPIGHPTICR